MLLSLVRIYVLCKFSRNNFNLCIKLITFRLCEIRFELCMTAVSLDSQNPVVIDHVFCLSVGILNFAFPL